MTVNPHIFRALDIRGKVGVDLTPRVAELIGRGIGTSMQARGQSTVVTGRDNRLSSDELARALQKGLVAAGRQVVDIGCVATPVLYWAAVTRGHVGGVMLTASHLGPEYNGVKICVGSRTLFGAEIAEIRDYIVAGQLFEGSGELADDLTAAAAYLAHLQQSPPPARPLKVALDAGNGMAGPFAPAAFSALGYQVTPLFCTPDGAYPNHIPDPQSPANLRRLRQVVAEEGADLGFAYDGDADRVGVVDERGAYVGADRVAVLVVRDLLARHPGAKVVLDVLCSQVLVDEIVKGGGQPILWKSGHSFIKDKLRQEGGLLGVEMSGHMFFADNHPGYDDGIYASLRIASLVAASDSSLSQLMASAPTLFATPEYRPHCPDDQKRDVVSAVKERLARRHPVVDVDGVRVTFPAGWGLLRASNTEAVLSLRFEAETEDDLVAYREVFRQALSDFSYVEAF